MNPTMQEKADYVALVEFLCFLDVLFWNDRSIPPWYHSSEKDLRDNYPDFFHHYYIQR